MAHGGWALTAATPARRTRRDRTESRPKSGRREGKKNPLDLLFLFSRWAFLLHRIATEAEVSGRPPVPRGGKPSKEAEKP